MSHLSKKQAEIIRHRHLDVEIVRTRRKKTFQLQVYYDKVSVLSPRNASLKQIRQVLENKKHWLEAKLAEQAARPRPVERQFVDGECLLVLGESFILQLVTGPRQVDCQTAEKKIIVSVPARVTHRADYIRRTLTDWYKALALETLETRAAMQAVRLQLYPSAIAVKTFKSRWGSCDTKGNLLFNWKLIMAPTEIIDYVIVHELCHLQHHNHSPDFWRCVAQAQPDFKRRKQWLRDNAGLLDF